MTDNNKPRLTIMCGIPEYGDWMDCIAALNRDLSFGHRIYYNKLRNINKVTDFIVAKRIDIVIPLSQRQVQFCIQFWDTMVAALEGKELASTNIQYNTRILCDKTYANVSLFDNKVRFTQFMIDSGLSDSIPTIHYTNRSDITERTKIHEYPCVFKLSYSVGGSGVFLCNNKDEMADLHRKNQGQTYMVQRYIKGTEHSAHLFVNNGIIKKAYYYRCNDHKVPVYIQHGRMHSYDKDHDFGYTDAFDKMFRLTGYTGFACIDFKVDGDSNSVKIFEVNPRLGGTVVHDHDDLKGLFIEAISNMVIS